MFRLEGEDLSTFMQTLRLHEQIFLWDNDSFWCKFCLDCRVSRRGFQKCTDWLNLRTCELRVVSDADVSLLSPQAVQTSSQRDGAKRSRRHLQDKSQENMSGILVQVLGSKNRFCKCKFCCEWAERKQKNGSLPTISILISPANEIKLKPVVESDDSMKITLNHYWRNMEAEWVFLA